MRRVFVNAARPHRDAIQEAARLIHSGRVVAIPTDTLYGLAADPFSAEAVARVFAIKGRSARQPLPLIAADIAQVEGWLAPLDAAGRRLADRFWPGPLTLLLTAPPGLAKGVTAGESTVGVRVPHHAVAQALCRAVGRPVTSTSANVSGAPATADPELVEASLGRTIDLLIDA